MIVGFYNLVTSCFAKPLFLQIKVSPIFEIATWFLFVVGTFAETYGIFKIVFYWAANLIPFFALVYFAVWIDNKQKTFSSAFDLCAVNGTFELKSRRLLFASSFVIDGW